MNAGPIEATAQDLSLSTSRKTTRITPRIDGHSSNVNRFISAQKEQCVGAFVEIWCESTGMMGSSRTKPRFARHHGIPQIAPPKKTAVELVRYFVSFGPLESSF